MYRTRGCLRPCVEKSRSQSGLRQLTRQNRHRLWRGPMRPRLHPRDSAFSHLSDPHLLSIRRTTLQHHPFVIGITDRRTPDGFSSPVELQSCARFLRRAGRKDGPFMQPLGPLCSGESRRQNDPGRSPQHSLASRSARASFNLRTRLGPNKSDSRNHEPGQADAGRPFLKDDPAQQKRPRRWAIVDPFKPLVPLCGFSSLRPIHSSQYAPAPRPDRLPLLPRRHHHAGRQATTSASTAISSSQHPRQPAMQ